MTSKFKTAFYLTTILGCASAIATTGAWGAQTSSTADQGAQEIEQVIVTATRREQRLQDVPISITVFNQQQLEKHNVISGEGLAAFTPSLSVNTNFGSQNTSFAIRGFVQDIGTEPSVGVYFADVVAPRGPTQGTTAGDGAGPGDFFDLENVQVLKGPQGTLFGRNTTGGDILIVPKKPGAEFGGYIQGSFGNYNMRGGQGVINIPVNDNIRLRFGVDHQSRDGYLKNTSGIGPSRFDDVNFTALRASADINITPNLENYTIATYSQTDTNGSYQKLIACDPTAGTIFTSPLLSACNQITPGATAPTPYQGADFYDAAQSHPDPYSKTRLWRVINKTTWLASDNLTVKNIASFARFKDSFSAPLFGTNFYTPDLSAVPLFGIPSYSTYFSAESLAPGIPNTFQDTYTEELQLQGNNFDNRLTWTAGFYLEGSDPVKAGGFLSPILISCTDASHMQCVDPVGYLLALNGAVPVGTPIASENYTVGKTFYNNYAIYTQATYKLTDKLSLTGGFRYTWDRESNTSTQITYHFPYPNTILPGSPTTITSLCTFPDAPAATCRRNFTEKSQAPTWLIDLDYKPNEDTLLYAKWARGYRAGVIVQNIVPPFNNVGPERVDDFEAGAKTTFHGLVEGTLDINGFYNNFFNQQLLLGFNANPNYCGPGCPAPVSPTAAPVNAGKSRIYGVELSSTIIPYDGVTLNIAYTYLHTELVQVQTFSLPPGSLYTIAGSQRKGDELPLSPHNKISVSASYTLPLDQEIGKITIGGTFVHTDKQLTNYIDRNGSAIFGAGGSVFDNLGYIQPTDLLSLNATWQSVMSKPIDLSIFATNVTGQKYYTWIPGLAAGLGFENAEVGAPTMYGIRIKYHFGDE